MCINHLGSSRHNNRSNGAANEYINSVQDEGMQMAMATQDRHLTKYFHRIKADLKLYCIYLRPLIDQEVLIGKSRRIVKRNTNILNIYLSFIKSLSVCFIKEYRVDF